MRITVTSFALVRQFASVAVVGNLTIYRNAMELPHCHEGKKHVPVPTGKYVVGCTDLMIGPSQEDGCFLRIYYPSQLKDTHENSTRWASWLPHEKYIEGYTTVLGIMPFFGKKLISWAFGNSYIPVVVDAEPCTEQKFPVIVFSHGLTACRTAYSFFCSDISSHGFIVVATEHRDGSACMTYSLEKEPNAKGGLVEKWIPYKPMQFEKDDMPLRQEQLQIRTRECSQALDLLYKLDEGVELEHVLYSSMNLGAFKDVMDLSTPMIAGHSFGSATLLRTLAVDKRFKIGLAMDAWMWPLKDQPELAQEIEQPLLFINMEAFQTAPNLKAMKRFTVDADHTERRVVTLKGSVHKNQVDLPFLLPLYLRRLTGSHSAIDPVLAMELNNRITMLYLRKHLGHPVDEEHSKLVEKHSEWFYEGIP
ncbi:platelet-activating factor acetylhydrolase-like [Daphnia carinata]|uniref:platelet-activating factor acetylhydrolase-like n=1 Tax=Daphnia carinata TaxID=120202 RepID=UPI00257B21B9|nr:platelet-activating factor acetylhydrolase-like [Daphnia carinata]